MKFQHLLLAFAFVAGCGMSDESDVDTGPTGNDALGIASFTQEETSDQTILLGLDASGGEVARLILVHGRFTPITGDYVGETDGRQLQVQVLGQRMQWETTGFDPVLEMPAHPPSQDKLAAFLSDPHVTPVLDHWGIGFQKPQPTGDAGYTTTTTGNYRGDSPQDCSGQLTCGSAYFDTINTCTNPAGNTTTGVVAARVNRRKGGNCGLYNGVNKDEVGVATCCPADSIVSMPWFTWKLCPLTDDHNTSCGLHGAGACKSCAGYLIDATNGCSVSLSSSVGTCHGVDVYQLDWSYTEP